MPLRGGTVERDYLKLVKLGLVRDIRPYKGIKATRSSMGSKEAQQAAAAAAAGPGEDLEWDPDTLDVVGEINKVALNRLKGANPAKKIRSWFSYAAAESEASLLDVRDDVISLRFLLFFTVPKVKFAMHFASHLAYCVVFSSFILVDTPGVLVPSIKMREVVLWLWALTRFIDEITEIGSFDGKGLYQYIRDPWNVQDVILFVLTVLTAVFRLHTANVALSDAQKLDPAADSVFGLSLSCDPGATDGCTFETWPRTLYAFISVMVYSRCLQYLRYFRSAGVLTIVIGHMMSDVAVFLVVLSCFIFGFSFAFVVMQPENFDSNSVHFLETSSPLYDTVWGVFGIITPARVETDLVGQVQPGEWSSPVYIWLYLFVAQIVLINLLIAMMSDTYARVTGEGLLRWQFERAQLIDEFMGKKPMPPPLNIFWFVFVTIPSKVRTWYRRTYLDEEDPIGGFAFIPKMQILNKYRAEEIAALKRALQTRDRSEEESLEARLDALQSNVGKLTEQSRTNLEAFNGRLDELSERLPPLDDAHDSASFKNRRASPTMQI